VGWQLLSQHPWTGLGAFAAGPFGVFEKLGLNNVGPLHSDYIETMVGTSFWGLVPLLVALLGCWWVLLRWMGDRFAPPGDRQLAMEAMAVLTVITLRSVFMTFIVMHPPLNFTVILCYAESVRRRRKAVRIERSVPDAVAA
jgi:O-antigen ligase